MELNPSKNPMLQPLKQRVDTLTQLSKIYLQAMHNLPRQKIESGRDLPKTSEKGSTLNEMWSQFFPFRLDPFSEMRQNKLDSCLPWKYVDFLH